jgi:hypothetical protein
MIAVVLAALFAAVAPAWSDALPIDAAAQIGVSVNGTLLLGGQAGKVTALDARSGRMLWRADESEVLLPLGYDVVLGTLDGRIRLVNARSGSPLWTARACPANDAATALAVIAGDIVAGCSRGHVARIDLRTGRVAAQTDMTAVDQIDAIEPAGGCAINLKAHMSGAILSEQDAIVGCRSLRAIMPQRQEVWFLGTVAGRAVMADQCCGASGAMEKPVGVFTVDGSTGVSSDETAFLSGRPFLAGSQVCVVQHAAVRCRSAGASGDGHAVIAGVADDPDVIEPGLIGFVRVVSGSAVGELDDVSRSGFHRIWSGATIASALAFGLPDLSGDVPVRMQSGEIIVGRDGRSAAAPLGAYLVASDAQRVYVTVRTDCLIGNRYVEELRAIPWQSGTPAP